MELINCCRNKSKSFTNSTFNFFIRSIVPFVKLLRIRHKCSKMRETRLDIKKNWISGTATPSNTTLKQHPDPQQQRQDMFVPVWFIRRTHLWHTRADRTCLIHNILPCSPLHAAHLISCFTTLFKSGSCHKQSVCRHHGWFRSCRNYWACECGGFWAGNAVQHLIRVTELAKYKFGKGGC